MRKKLLCALLAVSMVVSSGTMLPNTQAVTASAASTSVSPFTGKTYTHSDVFQGKNVYHGIDVSYHNGAIDWAKAAADGVEYAFIRVGYRGWGSGTVVEDPRFKTYIKDALDAGVHVGLYFFTEARTTKEAIEEANFCLKMAANYDIELPIAFDYEYQYSDGSLVSPKAGISKAQATANCEAFCDTISAGGYTPMIYANSSDLKTLIDGASLQQKYMIWLANYTTKTSYTGEYDIWQYSSTGKINGFTTNVDCNFWYSDTDIAKINFNSGELKDAAIAKIPTQIYTGKEIKPALTVTLNRRGLKAGRDYTVTYSNNKKPGKATVTITGKGNFTGTRTTSFTIKPKAVSGITAKSGSKKITLTWKGATGGDGYEIYRSSEYNGTYKKVKTLTKATTKKWVNKKLAKDREYFYKIRAYRKVNGKEYFGAYLKVSAGTTPGGKGFQTKTAMKLLKKPSAKSAKRATIPAGATVHYIGKTVLKNKAKFYHVQFHKGSKTFDGYLTSIKGLKLRKTLITAKRSPLKQSASASAKTLATLPKNMPVIVLKTKKSGKHTWYMTVYLKGKKLHTGYVNATQF